MKTKAKLKAVAWTAWTIICLGTFTYLLFNLNWASSERRTTNSIVVSKTGHAGYLGFDLYYSIKSYWANKNLYKIDTTPYRAFVKAIRDKDPAPTNPNKRHLIYIQMESTDGLAIETSHKGKPLMPFLYSLKNSCTYLSNTLDNTNSGRTSDAELLSLTSLPAIYGEPAFTRYDLGQTPSLPRTLREHGFYTFSMHGYVPNFWNRRNAHIALGFEDTFFRDDLDASDMLGFGISDDSILQQSVDKIAASDRPVFAHIVLLTNHHPYNYVSKRSGIPRDTIAENYIDSLRYMDNAIEHFFQKLKEQGLLEDCIIGIYGDHDSSIRADVASIVQFERKPIIKDSIPLLIYGTKDKPTVVKKATGLQDLPVIALNELGIAPPHTFTGNPLSSNLPTLNPVKGSTVIVNGSIANRETEVDLSTYTKLAILYPEQLASE